MCIVFLLCSAVFRFAACQQPTLFGDTGACAVLLKSCRTVNDDFFVGRMRSCADRRARAFETDKRTDKQTEESLQFLLPEVKTSSTGEWTDGKPISLV